jgi:hypothetical protein
MDPNFTKGVDSQGVFYEVEYLFDNWADSDNVLISLLGATTYVNGNLVRIPPHQHPLAPYCFCQQASVVEGYGGPLLNAAGYPQYQGGFKVKASYRPFTLIGEIDYSQDMQNQIDPTTPVLWCTQELDFDTDVFSLPNHKFKWVTDNTAANVPFRVEVGVTVMKLTFHRVPYMPVGIIRQLRGRLNSVKFLGAAAGTVRFRGGTTTREFSTDGSVNQKVSLVFAERDVPWDQFFRPDKMAWDTMQDAAGNTGYYRADLSPLILL